MVDPRPLERTPPAEPAVEIAEARTMLLIALAGLFVAIPVAIVLAALAT